MIDLHLHTTASDGCLTPADLVATASAAGLTVLSVTDHDTVAGLGEARRAATRAGLEFVDGIEITAVDDGNDVHVLGYFVRPPDHRLAAFLSEQRAARVARMRHMGERLARLGVTVDVEALIAGAAEMPGASVGRPLLARALVRAGRAVSVDEAFRRYLGTGKPGFVPRSGPSPAEVVQVIHAAGGLASMAHPGITRRPQVLGALVAAGLDAIEVYHSDHPEDVRLALLDYATRHRLLTTGGSDFHGDGGARTIGQATLPLEEFDRLRAAAFGPEARA
ncbi:MAG: PHP domain-containing protein [Acidobacteriota bacterium]